MFLNHKVILLQKRNLFRKLIIIRNLVLFERYPACVVAIYCEHLRRESTPNASYNYRWSRFGFG